VAGQIGHLVVDECHRAPSRTFTDAVTAFDCRYMLGQSTTPWRRDRLGSLIFWHLGDLRHEVKPEALLRDGDVLPAAVILRETDFRTRLDPVQDYPRMLAELTAATARNLLIAGDVAREARESPGTCLVLSDRKAHCENLQAILRYRFKTDAVLLTGDLSPAVRRETLGALEEGRIKVLIATGQLLGEGLDCRNLHTLFLATPIRFSGRLIQYLGRVLRPAPGKERARVFDYVDDGVETLRTAAAARRNLYRRSAGLFLEPAAGNSPGDDSPIEV